LQILYVKHFLKYILEENFYACLDSQQDRVSLSVRLCMLKWRPQFVPYYCFWIQATESQELNLCVAKTYNFTERRELKKEKALFNKDRGRSETWCWNRQGEGAMSVTRDTFKRSRNL